MKYAARITVITLAASLVSAGAAGKPGIEEINVDALTGKVIAHEHESPKAEKMEAAQEKKSK